MQSPTAGQITVTINLTPAEYHHFITNLPPPGWELRDREGLIDPFGPHTDENRCRRYQLVKHSS